ncbi:hypothetical protein N008_07380 [Hymenobacter sp. APR13]|nr:hypothetical protein N008_07380 [Hymenobacter sp. APR13]
MAGRLPGTGAAVASRDFFLFLLFHNRAVFGPDFGGFGLGQTAPVQLFESGQHGIFPVLSAVAHVQEQLRQVFAGHFLRVLFRHGTGGQLGNHRRSVVLRRTARPGK